MTEIIHGFLKCTRCTAGQGVPLQVRHDSSKVIKLFRCYFPFLIKILHSIQMLVFIFYIHLKSSAPRKGFVVIGRELIGDG